MAALGTLLRLRADGDVQKDWKSVDAVAPFSRLLGVGVISTARAAQVIDGMLPPGAGVKLKTLLDVPTGLEHASATGSGSCICQVFFAKLAQMFLKAHPSQAFRTNLKLKMRDRCLDMAKATVLMTAEAVAEGKAA